MTAIAALVMHVNVATRFLSSCPALYWFAAVRLTQGRGDDVVSSIDRSTGQGSRNDNEKRAVQWACDWIWLWAIISGVLGCILFPNFFPWT